MGVAKNKIKNKDKLNEKQMLFCLYYVKNFNATQSYLNAYGCSYNTALTNGSALLGITRIRQEITRLKQEKAKSIMVGKNDILERYIRIAFADMKDFVEFGIETVPVMSMFGPMQDPKTGETITKEVNYVRFKEGKQVDGGLICQIKQGKEGASLKLEDRQKALEWLANYFEMNPMDNHRKTFDKKKLELEEKKLNVAENMPDVTFTDLPVPGSEEDDGEL